MPLAFGAGFVSSTVSCILTPVKTLAVGARFQFCHLDSIINSSAAKCIVDLTEGKDTTAALQQCIVVLCLSPYDQTPLSPLVSRLMGGLRHAVQTISIAKPDSVHGADTIFEPWKMVFWFEVQAVARALLGENDLEDAKFTMIQWLDLRVVTISGNCHVFLSDFILFSAVLDDTFSSPPRLYVHPLRRLSLVFTANTYIPFPSETSAGLTRRLLRSVGHLRHLDCRSTYEPSFDSRSRE